MGSHGHNGVWAGTQHTPCGLPSGHSRGKALWPYFKVPKRNISGGQLGGDGGYMGLSLNNGKMCFFSFEFQQTYGFCCLS